MIRVDFPTDWCSPIVVVSKDDGTDIRLCSDLPIVNKAIKRVHFPAIKFNNILANLKGSKFFSKLDAKSSFHKITVNASSQLLTTITTFFSRYIYTRLPFGVN